MTLEIYPEDCIIGADKLKSGSVKLGIFDPPFGIEEAGFNKHYKRDAAKVIDGYQEAPPDYGDWTRAWLDQAERVLHEDGSIFIIMGHTNLRHVLNAAEVCNLELINHCIWKYNFGCNTKTKFVTSHYHVLYYAKPRAKRTFNLNCRFGSHEKTENGKNSLLYQDLEDVWVIPKEYMPGETKNMNKLPESLIDKIILYASNPGDLVCDFFMGNFTTAYSALKLGRPVAGFEINQNAYDYHMPLLEKVEFGHGLKTLREVEDKRPKNQGKKITEEEVESICKDYLLLLDQKMLKKNISAELQEKYGRGRFAIKNILDKNLKRFLK